MCSCVCARAKRCAPRKDSEQMQKIRQLQKQNAALQDEKAKAHSDREWAEQSRRHVEAERARLSVERAQLVAGGGGREELEEGVLDELGYATGSYSARTDLEAGVV